MPLLAWSPSRRGGPEGDQARTTVSGQVELDPNQLTMLKSGRLYVQIDSEKVPAARSK